jgi:3-deoxy-manno-octulosonate cytidylyltransferase (CMP-KDO synthetase)
MRVIGVIPARMNSSRLPDKPLADIDGMPMIGHCYWRTVLALGDESTYVATCDKEIQDYIAQIGGKAIMTQSSHTRATTRAAEALEWIENKSGEVIDIILMIQGDEPLVQPEVINSMVDAFNDDSVDIVNIMSRIESKSVFEDENNVKVVVDYNKDALYFSREPIPSAWKGFDNIPCFMQTGIIGFRRDALIKFNSMKETSLEQIESVDMNRVLEMGGSIRMILMQGKTIGVDVLEDLEQAELLIRDDPTRLRYT